MAYQYGNRKQRTLFPQSIDEYIPHDAPVRAYDVFVDSLDFAELGIDINPHKVGCPQYDPKIMLKLLLYGYSYGVRSSRKLEREANYNLSFIWLTGGLKPDHKTIAEFRRNNKAALRNVLKQCARLCVKLEQFKFEMRLCRYKEAWQQSHLKKNGNSLSQPMRPAKGHRLTSQRCSGFIWQPSNGGWPKNERMGEPPRYRGDIRKPVLKGRFSRHWISMSNRMPTRHSRSFRRYFQTAYPVVM